MEIPKKNMYNGWKILSRNRRFSQQKPTAFFGGICHCRAAALVRTSCSNRHGLGDHIPGCRQTCQTPAIVQRIAPKHRSRAPRPQTSRHASRGFSKICFWNRCNFFGLEDPFPRFAFGTDVTFFGLEDPYMGL